jgi:hypothetical protein
MRTLTVAAIALLLSSCNSKPVVREVPKVVETPRPTNESRRFPKTNLVGTIVVEKGLLGKSFMPGGTLAQYKKGRTEYEMFLARAVTATDAALILRLGACDDGREIPSVLRRIFRPRRGTSRVRIHERRMDRWDRGTA